jgi:Phytanoyl-CoA dioxygenase (PhyH)
VRFGALDRGNAHPSRRRVTNVGPARGLRVTAVFFDRAADDETRRDRIYRGDIFVYSPRPSTVAFAEFARSLVEEAFAPLDPVEAQFDLPVERFVEIVAPLQPRFIHHPESKRLIQAIVDDLGCDPALTYFDVPRLRVQAHDDYLTAGVGYRLHPHRDTWYAAPMSQLNWWSAVYPFEAESAMSFFPKYFDRAVQNGSHDFDMYEWNSKQRRAAAQQVGKDTRKQPRAEEALDLEGEFRLVVPPGGLIMFSGAQLHATVPNTSGRTRFSVDFRTVHADDVAIERGAVNVDSHGRGTTLRAHLRGTDLEPLPEELARIYDPSPPADAVLVYKPDATEPDKTEPDAQAALS